MREALKSAFVAWPHCLATYVCLVGMTCLLAFGWKPTKRDFAIYESAIPLALAEDAAAKLGGKVWQVSATGSMRPLLAGGEYVVTVANFDAIERGQVLVYHATYNRNPIIHRAVELDAHGWLMSGDSAPVSESWARVTRENYLGTVVLGYKNIEKNTL
jgi:hypothetical protein